MRLLMGVFFICLPDKDKIMFELTIKGRTREFETAEEMYEWKERMLTPKFKPKNRHKSSKPSKNVTIKK